MIKPTIGSDPELMLSKEGSIVSAIPVVKHDKHNRLDLGDGHVLYYDNTMIETCIPPASSKQDFVENIRGTYKKISKAIGSEYQMIAIPSHSFSKEECEHPDAMLSGCDPEFDCYSRKMCFPPSFKNQLRSGGGHIHLGRDDFKQIDPEQCDRDEFLIGVDSKRAMIKLMDLFVGVPMVLIDNSSSAIARKELYGKAGRFRPTSYGVEYRTLSNFWLSSPALAGLVYDLTFSAFEYARSQGKHDNGQTAETIINGNDQSGAKEIISNLGIDSDLRNRITEMNNFIPKALHEEWNI